MKKTLLMAALAAAVVGLGLIKTIPVKNIMIFSIIGLLLLTCNNGSNNVEFMPHIQRKICDPYGCRSYVEDVLVKNMPKNKLEQSKIMIAYFDSVGLSIDDLVTKMPEVNLYIMFFYKSTNAKYYVVKNNETSLGTVALNCCKDDTTRWEVTINRPIPGVYYEDGDYRNETVVLLNPCEPIHPYWATENRELENYYNELRDKRNNKD